VLITVDRLPRRDGDPYDAAYTVAVPSYLVRGGDGYTAFARGRALVDGTSGPQVAQIVMDAIVARGAIAPTTDGRIGRAD
jgi:2',3'-cyclic-nucleotide 2'-phosphodiesterase (5'-nucleotidase family)